ncbi:MAG TPA: hypothetical protein VE685_14790 [Thermoanaerobaculia bacterium]|nr:hypothetical protein [Thermoanaerobaculia bacterium]
MKRFCLLAFAVGLYYGAACGPGSQSDRSFDQICDMVQGKTAAEVESLLGVPDVREEILEGDERWVWWNYTFLDGDNYPPEMRGRIVHLEILFQNPAPLKAQRPSYSEWRLSDPLAVSYSLPAPKI